MDQAEHEDHRRHCEEEEQHRYNTRESHINLPHPHQLTSGLQWEEEVSDRVQGLASGEESEDRRGQASDLH